MRYGMTEAFGLPVNKTSLFNGSSSFLSITKSTKEKFPRACKLLCLMLYVEPDSTTILLIAHFYPAAPVRGRRNVKVESPLTYKYFLSCIKHNLVLKPAKVSMESTWLMPVDDYVTVNEMIFINEVVHDLRKEAKLKLILQYS
ncbi:unnamed protein product [Rotaria sp. Silwood2]|nr:unnamed protein product [Rotaria sp. Silwood2]CAF3380271.1 unnamed protein product [Rotaria sp. Silwood2]CAF3941950.1 unnamed protein product [Rotaria sp. Silwood2]CAF4455567.1 unnamed protein product [Rotaria sp. Silwood2]